MIPKFSKMSREVIQTGLGGWGHVFRRRQPLLDGVQIADVVANSLGGRGRSSPGKTHASASSIEPMLACAQSASLNLRSFPGASRPRRRATVLAAVSSRPSVMLSSTLSESAPLDRRARRRGGGEAKRLAACARSWIYQAIVIVDDDLLQLDPASVLEVDGTISAWSHGRAHHDLVAVAIDGQLRAARNLAGAMRRKQHQIDRNGCTCRRNLRR